MKFRALTLSAAALSAITAAAIPAAGAAAVAHAAASTRGPGCVKVQTLTFTNSQDAAARRYWSPARMKVAKGFSQVALRKLSRSQRLPKGTAPASAVHCTPKVDLSSAVAASAPRVAPLTTASSGYPTVGKLTFDADGVLSLNCTATVINGAATAKNNELIVTAAHCIEGTTDGVPYFSTDLAFSPMWHDNQNPYGTWTARKVFLSSNWMNCVIPLIDCSTNPLYDYAIIVLDPNEGKDVGDVTGSNGWSVNQPRNINNVTIAGIPGTSSSTLTSLANTFTVTESGNPYREAATPGLTDGSSGGPWFQDFDTETGRGTLLGDTGGYEEGGPSSGSPSYANNWTTEFAALIKSAVNYEG